MGNFIWALLILLAAGLILVIFWQRELRVPRLVHTRLPPYDVPDVILVGGVMIENRGRAAAPNVKVEIQYGQGDSARIQHMHIASDEPYIMRGGGEQYNFATIRLRELRPGKKLVVYWAAREDFQPHISVTSFQPTGKDLVAQWRESGQKLFQGMRPRR